MLGSRRRLGRGGDRAVGGGEGGRRASGGGMYCGGVCLLNMNI